MAAARASGEQHRKNEVVARDALCRLLGHTPRCGLHRARFLAAALADLRARQLRAGSGLAVLHGAPEEAIGS